MHKLLKVYAAITSIGMIIVILQGALVTKTGSGEGCGPTWPLCFGEFMPSSPAIETIIEYSHRIVSGSLGIMVIILAIWTWRKLPHLRETKFMALMAVLFIAFQGLLGAGAVVWGQSTAVLALHFGISAISFTTVFLLTALVFESGRTFVPTPKVGKGFKYFVFFVLTYCYAVIYTGAYVKHSKATLACSGFPLCNEQLIPQLSGPVGAHFAHRVFATLLLVFVLILFIHVLLNYKQQKLLVWGSALSLLLVSIQFISGIAIVLTGATLTIALIHALIVTLLFASLCYLAMTITR